MEQRMSAWETRRQFGKVLKDVSTNDTSVIVESHGEAVAVVVPIDVYRSIQWMRSTVFDEFRAISQRVNMTEEEAAPYIAAAMRETGREPE